MADNDRYRYDRNREDYGRGRDRSAYGNERERGPDYYGRSADYGHRDDEGYIARRGFGNERSGYDRHDRGNDQRHDRGRGRDFGDSAGYGSGGSTRDWRDVMGDDRTRGRASYGMGYDRTRERGYGGGYGAGSSDYGRYGSSDFGRGSREDDDDRGFFERAGDEIRSWFGDDEAERRRDRDMRQGEAYHRGRGPRNYTRSDDRIREDVNDRLTDDPHVDASDIEVTVSNREVTLSGTVNSRFEKRHAEDLAESISGVTHVQNNLRVQQQGAMGGLGGGMNAPSTGSSEAGGASGGTGSTMGATGSTGSAGASLGTNPATTSGRRRSSTAGT